MIKSILLITLLSGLLPSQYSLAVGVENSVGGAEDYRVQPAFFLSHDRLEAITTCLKVSDNFGVDRVLLTELITESFNEWKTYLVQKRLYVVPHSIFAQTELRFNESCQGDENLTFYFGLSDDLVQKYVSQFSKPFGFAQLYQPRVYTTPQQVARPAKGFVWIAGPNQVDADQSIPHWGKNNSRALYGLILHEVGHVFGNAHVDGTCMTQKIAEHLRVDTSPREPPSRTELYSKIDSEIELIPCLECKTRFKGDDSKSLIQLPDQEFVSDAENTFYTLMGTRPVGQVSMHFDRLGSPPGSGYLTLMDELTQERFFVDVRHEVAPFPDNAPLLVGHGGKRHYSFGVSYLAVIRTKTGNRLRVNVNYNVEKRKLIISEQPDLEASAKDFFGRILFKSKN